MLRERATLSLPPQLGVSETEKGVSAMTDLSYHATYERALRDEPVLLACGHYVTPAYATRPCERCAALEPFAFITLEDCQYCSEIIWPGPDHYNECPVATARRALLGIGEFG
jgi:hypothetical protein